MDTPLVSIIMAVYNCQSFIREAVQSVILQSYTNWELIIIDDGSTDESPSIIRSFYDSRIRIYTQSNNGVASARNIGLSLMKGDFFCFLDADDIYPVNSLKSRLDAFKNSEEELEFVDGRVEELDVSLTNLLRVYKPSYMGNPLRPMVRLSESCYLGQTWMIRRNKMQEYAMNDDFTHGEDFLFLLQLTRNGGKYSYTDDLILIYRRHTKSAMNNLVGLNESYLKTFNEIKLWKEISLFDSLLFWVKTRKIMFLSFLFIDKSLKLAIRSLFQL